MNFDPECHRVVYHRLTSGQAQWQDIGATSRHAHAVMHLGRGRHRRSLSASRACGDRVHRLEVSSLTSDTRRVADITPTVFLPFSHAGRLPLDALDRRPGGGKSRGGRPGLELSGIQYVHPIDGRTVYTRTRVNCSLEPELFRCFWILLRDCRTRAGRRAAPP